MRILVDHQGQATNNALVPLEELAALYNKWLKDPNMRALFFIETGEILHKSNREFDRNAWHLLNSTHVRSARPYNAEEPSDDGEEDSSD